MASIAQNLQTLIQTKADIKAALEGKGQDLSNVPFTRYARVIEDMAGGDAPTLNAPTISLNANGGYLNVTDYKNGNFTQAYRLYLNGTEITTFTEKSIVMTEYGISETDQITIQAVAELFNPSPLSNMTKWDDLTEGTLGLTYSGRLWTGLGTATATDIYVASIVNGTTITEASSNILKGTVGKIIYLPDSMTTINQAALSGMTDCNVIFGTAVSLFAFQAFVGSKNCVYDFRRATKIPTLQGLAFNNVSNLLIIVPDSLYDEWIVATNWSAGAQYIIRATDYEVQGGSV